MSYLSKKKFNELADIRSANCISMYIPTVNVGDQSKNTINFKNQLKKVKNELAQSGFQEREIDKVLEPATNLLEDSDFWNELSKGLAVFVYDGKLETFISDHTFHEKAYVHDHLHLLQLVEEVGKKTDFYLLLLSGNTVGLYHGNNEDLKPINTGDDIPKSLKDAVGFDYEQKALQHRSGHSEAEGTMYHGQGSGGDAENKREFEKFFRTLDDGLSNYLPSDGSKPLVVASDEHTFHHFREVSDYPGLFEKPLRGNHEETSESELLSESLKLILENTDSGLKDAKANFDALLAKGQSSSETSKVIGAAFYGQVEDLFISKNAELYGYFSPDSNEVTIHSNPETSSVDLLNFVAVHTMKKDGKVYLIQADEMPDETAPVNANFRYDVVSA